MDKLDMRTPDKVDENIAKIGNLFPNCITETLDENGKPVKAIDFAMLKQELSKVVVDGPKERYQFTWPNKKKSMLLANSPISATLRPCRAESVNFDETENLYIEGDNLDVLKLLQETYLGKVKMIYIDPPYNTGNDFIYEDNFDIDSESYKDLSGDYDDQGNRLRKNNDTNGRFHTDWLNMMYPRLKLARDLLRDDGVIFISIDDNEVANLRKVCDEIFGESNFIATFPWRKRTAKSDVPFGVSQDYEWIISYAKSSTFLAAIKGGTRKYFETEDLPGRPWRIHDLSKQTTAAERPNSYFTMINPRNGDKFPCNPNRTWAITTETFDYYYNQNKIVFPGDYDFINISRPAFRYFKDDDVIKAGDNFGKIALSTKLPDDIGMSQDGTKEIRTLFENAVFSFPKTSNLIKHLQSASTQPDDIILDFFSGSATTAHAVMQLNAEDGGNRKFIMVQIPETTDETSEAFKAGYKNICEIGKERIRRAGKKIREENAGKTGIENLDCGFRVLKLDSSNMKSVYYSPEEFVNDPSLFDQVHDNIKEDRSGEDLLFQVMLDLGIELSARITEETIDGKKVYSVKDGYLAACFETGVTDSLITEVAKRKPFYAVFRDSSFKDDAVAANFEQIFATYSPETVKKVL